MPVTNANNFQRARAALRFTQLPTWGNVYFCDSGSGSSTGGYHADAGTATLIQAQTLCTASNGDVVYVSPDHAESVIAAAGMTFSKAGVRYQGLGHGRMRPTITFSTDTAAQIIISGANITFANMVFDFTGIDAIVAAISVTAADVAFEDCEFITNSATAGVVLGILTAATATRFRVERCTFLGPAVNTGTTTTAAIKHEVGINYVIRDCFFIGKCTQSILNATAVLGGLIDNNTFHIYTGTKVLSMHASSTGVVSNNDCVVASGTTPMVGTIMSYVNNHYSTEGIGVSAGTALTF